MPHEDTSANDLQAIAAAGAVSHPAGVNGHETLAAHGRLLADATPPAKSYLDKAVGLVISNDTVERHVVEAAKAGAVFFGGRVGLATTVALYGLDQIKVGDTFTQAATDLGLGAIKGTAMRAVNTFAAARDFGIAGQAVALGVGSRVLDRGLDRHSWTDERTKSFSLDAGALSLARTALDRQALVADVASFAVGGAMAHGVNRFTERSLASSPFWKTAMTGGVFGVATGATGEIKRERDSGEQFSLAKVLAAGGTQGIYSAFAMAPAGMQASRNLRLGFLDSHGITTVGEKGSYRYTMRFDGGVHEMATSAPTNKGLRTAGIELTKMVEQRKLDLASSFGVSIARGGEPIQYSHGNDRPDEHFIAREPRLPELAVLDRSLSKSLPGHLMPDGKTAAKFNFIADRDVERASFGGLFEFQGGTPNIFLHNELLQNKPMTNRDPDWMKREDGTRRNSMETIVTHEIAHNGDHKVRSADKNFEANVREKLGWVRYRPGDFYEAGTHLLQGKEGGLYSYSPARAQWTLTDANGEAIDRSGAPARPGEEIRYTNDEMRNRALVRPISNYFDRPTEMIMEGVAHYRTGGDTRAALLRTSPVLYEQVKRQDEQEIAMHYGRDAAGRSAMLRMPDGLLSPRSAESEAAVAKYEREEAAKNKVSP
ncbi:MAG: hypothetical protein KGS72_17045 [Cyanobacteria bacterium REEB67]|nr:hypothetical protein [Cyanobacteria bacterium REEB67]